MTAYTAVPAARTDNLEMISTIFGRFFCLKRREQEEGNGSKSTYSPYDFLLKTSPMSAAQMHRVLRIKVPNSSLRPFLARKYMARPMAKSRDPSRPEKPRVLSWSAVWESLKAVMPKSAAVR